MYTHDAMMLILRFYINIYLAKILQKRKQLHWYGSVGMLAFVPLVSDSKFKMTHSLNAVYIAHFTDKQGKKRLPQIITRTPGRIWLLDPMLGLMCSMLNCSGWFLALLPLKQVFESLLVSKDSPSA